ncbi:MAG: hypothetical protein ABIP51_22645 [Bacteroidia bacterium]
MNTDNFQWTDELIKEFILKYNSSKDWITGVDPIIQEIIKFKKLKKYNAYRSWEIKTVKKNTTSMVVDFNECIFLDPDFNRGYSINSVLRLKDKELFTVGDKIDCKNYNTKQNIIISFKQDLDWMMVEYNIGQREDIDSINKSMKYLFTAYDGTLICEGDEVFMVNGAWALTDKCEITKEKYQSIKDHCIFFNTKEAAIYYILLNNPVLSLADIMVKYTSPHSSPLFLDFMNGLKELVKQRINIQ